MGNYCVGAGRHAREASVLGKCATRERLSEHGAGPETGGYSRTSIGKKLSYKTRTKHWNAQVRQPPIQYCVRKYPTSNKYWARDSMSLRLVERRSFLHAFRGHGRRRFLSNTTATFVQTLYSIKLLFIPSFPSSFRPCSLRPLARFQHCPMALEPYTRQY